MSVGVVTETFHVPLSLNYESSVIHNTAKVAFCSSQSGGEWIMDLHMVYDDSTDHEHGHGPRQGHQKHSQSWTSTWPQVAA